MIKPYTWDEQIAYFLFKKSLLFAYTWNPFTLAYDVPNLVKIGSVVQIQNNIILNYFAILSWTPFAIKIWSFKKKILKSSLPKEAL